MKRQVELLSPGGSLQGIKAAVNAGADAVYAGTSAFGARAYAENPEGESLVEAIEYCHLHGVKLYLTVNTLLKEREIREDLCALLLPAYEAGVDAVLVQDLGVFRSLREHFPDLPLHASTQMTISGLGGAALLSRMGASRVVLSRELSLKEIREIRTASEIELEVFVHGALCYCYSGQCLMSSFLGGRSGNRGRCAQPCRLPWQFLQENGKEVRTEGPYLLSLKDICTLNLLPDLIDAGISSLKIEGRMKRPEYAAAVTAIYRKYLDLYADCGRKGYEVNPEDVRILMDLYNRGGFSEGFLSGQDGPGEMSMKRPGHMGTKAAVVVSASGKTKERGPDRRKDAKNSRLLALEDLDPGDVLEEAASSIRIREPIKAGDHVPGFWGNYPEGTVFMRTHAEGLIQSLKARYLDEERQVPILADAEIRKDGSFLRVRTLDGAYEAVSEGPLPLPAEKRPLDPESVKKQIGKCGGTAFSLENVSVDLEEGLFLTIRDLNALRRGALMSLREKILESGRRAVPRVGTEKVPAEMEDGCFLPSPFHPEATCQVLSMEQLGPVLQEDSIGGVYLESSIFLYPGSPDPGQVLSAVHEAGKKCYIAEPYVFRKKASAAFSSVFHEDLLASFDGVLIRSLDELGEIQSSQERGVLPEGFECIADAGLYSWNSLARQEYRSLGITSDTLPLEETQRELQSRGAGGSEMILYGYLPLMISAHCFQKNTERCRKKPAFRCLKDRMGKTFPVRSECAFCTNLIYNSVPLDLLSLREEAESLNPGSFRLSFTVEGEEETKEILRAFSERRSPKLSDKTRGHFRTGVE